eukprot:CAMPEP_0175784700 /NCGR_PEP_ID=MMETSP0097-20121207/78948_1 /TAXON_ID=311494 /ORGANISM="Alexandrium monilatum, Strain CCMP3105" /LENGTH=57 /DNA_ID=CAMNT_0017095589 /DNA_START=103 /DNA_END=272 /DNA_ORIENTATION=+
MDRMSLNLTSTALMSPALANSFISSSLILHAAAANLLCARRRCIVRGKAPSGPAEPA